MFADGETGERQGDRIDSKASWLWISLSLLSGAFCHRRLAILADSLPSIAQLAGNMETDRPFPDAAKLSRLDFTENRKGNSRRRRYLCAPSMVQLPLSFATMSQGNLCSHLASLSLLIIPARPRRFVTVQSITAIAALGEHSSPESETPGAAR